MKFSIITIGETRWQYKDFIRRIVPYPEVCFGGVNGSEVNLIEELEKRDLYLPYPGLFSVGEVGVWLSVFDRWQWCVDNDEPLVVFEDDAIVEHDFKDRLELWMSELPEDWDFLCLWVPDNQKVDYLYNAFFDGEGRLYANGGNKTPETSIYNYGAENLARAYNGYGAVATVYSPQGARYFIDQARKEGLYTPVDCFLYQEAHTNRCKGFSPKPDKATLIRYKWPTSTVHITERFSEVYK